MPTINQCSTKAKAVKEASKVYPIAKVSSALIEKILSTQKNKVNEINEIERGKNQLVLPTLK